MGEENRFLKEETETRENKRNLLILTENRTEET